MMLVLMRNNGQAIKTWKDIGKTWLFKSTQRTIIAQEIERLILAEFRETHGEEK